ncbi:DUF2889 domain-containing protein [Gordonia liuliyuniae]|uniref:DUF2889 domain-containing protein n=1 Tax=Gordonia liuliyuniae TaxID=2911517 RepID=A0ABS9IP32_9ACTN|nr:DUF2889 domain-containing protein [Gordonia liuliyuniae]MCF8587290.1 DUF2889 domain-containing protein [Gordonia liuliyuniae]
MTWTDGWGTELHLDGRGRDLATGGDMSTDVLAASRMVVDVDPMRQIRRIKTIPEREGLSRLVGTGSGSGYRTRLADAVSTLVGSDPVDLLLDDVPGATLVSGFAFAQWFPIEELLASASKGAGAGRSMEGICTGFMPGSSGLAPDGTSRWTHRTRPVEPLGSGSDHRAWHELPEITEVSMRRARRIDVWREDSVVYVDAMFQDSSTRPAGGRIAVHEYALTATVDMRTGRLTSVIPEPHVLPYAECPLAVLNVDRLLGVQTRELRTVVLDELQGVAGCTHLNDALRALADIPYLVGRLS